VVAEISLKSDFHPKIQNDDTDSEIVKEIGVEKTYTNPIEN